MRAIDDFYAGLGGAIRKRREELKVTQAELSESIGLSRTSITNIERGRQRLLADQLLAVAKSLRISVDRLLDSASQGAGIGLSTVNSELAQMPGVARFVETTLANLRAEDA